MPVSLVARKKLMYAMQGYVSGEVFDARDESDASVLVKLGLASLASDIPEQSDNTEPRRSYRRRDLTAETE